MSLDWENERYVKLYTRDTIDWCSLPWQGRAVWPLLMRKLDRGGRLSLGNRGLEGAAAGIAGLIQLPVEVVEPGLAALLKDGTVVVEGSELIAPNFVPAQERPQSDAARAAAYRERKAAAKAAATHPVTESDAASRSVTPRHEEPQTVTPSRAVPSCAKSEASPLPPAAAGDPPVPTASPVGNLEAAVPAPEPLELLPQETTPEHLTPEGLVRLWNRVTGGKVPLKLAGKRARLVDARLRERPREADWLPAIERAAALRSVLGAGVGWLTLDWLVRHPEHPRRLVEGEFDWKLEEARRLAHGRQADPLRAIWDQDREETDEERKEREARVDEAERRLAAQIAINRLSDEERAALQTEARGALLAQGKAPFPNVLEAAMARIVLERGGACRAVAP